MEENFKLVIEYDGTGYCGWQRQAEHRTIQQTIENALARMTGRPVVLTGSGRTDAGVHANGQVASFKCATRLGPCEFINGLNSLLPDDIVILSCERAASDFHARFDVKSKVYRYCILNQPLPVAIGRHYAWWVRRTLDLEAMRAAAAALCGSHDFKAFEASGSPREHTRRNVIRAELDGSRAPHITFEIEADGFLRYMVRNIVGTLVHVGMGRLAAADVRSILASRDRAKAPPTAPPHGLFLVEVKY